MSFSSKLLLSKEMGLQIFPNSPLPKFEKKEKTQMESSPNTCHPSWPILLQKMHKKCVFSLTSIRMSNASTSLKEVIDSRMWHRLLIIFKLTLPHVLQQTLRKYQVNIDYNDSKTRQLLYKEAPANSEATLEQQQFQIIEKANLRVYCSGCELELTRQLHIITTNEHYCPPCFSNLEVYPLEYVFQPCLKLSPSATQWDIMDEIILISALRVWGYSNWNQIRQYMEYNKSPFPLEEIKQHYEQFHYHTPDNVLTFPSDQPRALPRTPYGELALRRYEQNLHSEPSDNMIKRKESKCEKKPNSNRNLPSGDYDGGLKPSISVTEVAGTESESRMVPENRNECPVLGYNPKRGEFETWYFDPDAEKLLDELEFYDTDSPEEFAIKIGMIEEYNRRLEERARRKNFVLEYQLLDSNYQFSLSPQEQKASLMFQPLMRYTPNQGNYLELINTFTTLTKQQNFITTLLKIRATSQEGQLSQTYDFLEGKRNKSIQKWEETYKKAYSDTRRRKVFRKQQKGDGEVVLVEEILTEEHCPIPLQQLEETIQEAKLSGNAQRSSLKVLSLLPESCPKQEEVPGSVDDI